MAEWTQIEPGVFGRRVDDQTVELKARIPKYGVVTPTYMDWPFKHPNWTLISLTVDPHPDDSASILLLFIKRPR